MKTKDIKRIATIKATGQRFLVAFVNFDTERATLFGQVTQFRGLQFTHAGFQTADLADVEISPVAVTSDLLRSLVAQYIDSRRAAGAKVESGGMRYFDHGTPRERADGLVLSASLRIPRDFPVSEVLRAFGYRVPESDSDEQIAAKLLAYAEEAEAKGQTEDASYILDLAVKFSG